MPKKKVIQSKSSRTTIRFRAYCNTHSWKSDWFDDEEKAIEAARQHRAEYPSGTRHNMDIEGEQKLIYRYKV